MLFMNVISFYLIFVILLLHSCFLSQSAYFAFLPPIYILRISAIRFLNFESTLLLVVFFLETFVLDQSNCYCRFCCYSLSLGQL
ncbi:hypothetical protein P879_09867 [Paragonimus westermani]|uniref:Uncharacterized protein n=1 Tax=Paragonimus westermani TaxID=34504 RepID=A0A8T0D9J6_9TREM|nr:hypothetical protein P879_09867 [Paragonimus westermani]